MAKLWLKDGCRCCRLSINHAKLYQSNNLSDKKMSAFLTYAPSQALRQTVIEKQQPGRNQDGSAFLKPKQYHGLCSIFDRAGRATSSNQYRARFGFSVTESGHSAVPAKTIRPPAFATFVNSLAPDCAPYGQAP